MKRWPEELEIFVRRNYGRLTQQEMADCLGKTKYAVMHKVQRLGLSQKHYITNFQFTGLTEQLSYLIGVVMGDGCLGKRQIVLKTIDKEFTEIFNRACESLVSKKSSIRPVRGRNQWVCGCYSVSLENWLKEVTRNKTIVPDVIKRASAQDIKMFLIGLMDSEASIRVFEGGSTSMYFSVKDDWIWTVKELLERVGVKTLPMRYTSGQPRFSINVKSYIEQRMYFNIKRKQKILDLVKEVE